jgi:hypothetical protein
MTEAERKRQARERLRAEGRRDRLFSNLTDLEHEALKAHLAKMRRVSQKKLAQ